MVKVRFAPSPTGYLHIGGARTALINYLFAKKMGGKLVLRIEDTDEARSTPEMTDAIIDGLSFLKIDYDEGPFFQSERKKIHQELAFKLLENGFAYKCFCSKEEIEERKRALPRIEEWKYDRRCRNLSKKDYENLIASNKPYCVRLKVPEGKIEWDDIVKGRICFDSSEIEDFVLLRSDLTPTYNLSVVADDYSMGITHIIRGEDHISNTPKQIAIYKAASIEPPLFGHLPLILGKDKKKLSKRHGTTSVIAFKEEGILPEALFHFLALIGSNLEEDRCLTKEEIIEQFDLKKLKKSASIFDYEKLLFLNGKYISSLEISQLKKEVEYFFKKFYPNKVFDDESLAIMRNRSKTLVELTKNLYPFVSNDFQYDGSCLKKINKEVVLKHFEGFVKELSNISEWKQEKIEKVLRLYSEKREIQAKDLIHPSRLFLLGKGESPSIFDVFYAMGKEKSIERLKRGINFLKNGGENV